MTPARRVDPRELWLLLATFLVAVAGLIYELIAATLSSYLLGDSVRQFSMVIGVFLSAMAVAPGRRALLPIRWAASSGFRSSLVSLAAFSRPSCS